MEKTIKAIDKFALRSFLDLYQKDTKKIPKFVKYEIEYVMSALVDICENNINPKDAFTREISYKELNKRYFFYALYVKYVARWIRNNTQQSSRPKGQKPIDIATHIIKIYTGEDLQTIEKAYKKFGKKADYYPTELVPKVKPIIKKIQNKKQFNWLKEH